jgi:hypothetical protein
MNTKIAEIHRKLVELRSELALQFELMPQEPKSHLNDVSSALSCLADAICFTESFGTRPIEANAR